MVSSIIENEYERKKFVPVPNYENLYEINLLGEVRALPKRVSSPICGGSRLLKARAIIVRPDLNGYPVFDIRVNSVRKRLFVHRIMAELYVANPHGKPYVNHIDGDKGNFDPSNLEWCTHRENMAHAYATGLAVAPAIGKGEKCPSSKLTDKDIRSIRLRLANGEKRLSVANDYGVSPGTIGFIKSKQTWSHVK